MELQKEFGMPRNAGVEKVGMRKSERRKSTCHEMQEWKKVGMRKGERRKSACHEMQEGKRVGMRKGERRKSTCLSLHERRISGGGEMSGIR